MSGWRTESEWVTKNIRLLQCGHACLPRVRLFAVALHSWSGPLGHFHQYLLLEPARTCTGVTLPFLVGCHWAAMSGWRAARELVTESFRPLQHGQPLPALVRLLTVVLHSWSGPAGHFHQHLLLEPAKTCSGETTPFLVGCH